MGVLTIRAADVLQIAQNFRAGAVEAKNAVYYRHLMLRTALELEDRAAALAEQGGSEIVPLAGKDDDTAA